MSWKNAMRMMTVAIALVGVGALSGTASAQVGIGISVGFAPPEIPVYEQPICPGEGYIWTPGYWAFDDDSQDYYWVPGTWVLAPEPGYLWTPGYWGWGGNAFFFHEGYWGPVVGFYGGINYGFGYFGRGYEGGRWEGGRFFYNREVNRINERDIRNVYNQRIDVRNESHVSFNGGRGGINERATSQEEAAARDRHVGMVGAQQEHVQAARSNQELRASANHGKPPIAATVRPGAFSGGGVVAAKSGGNYNPPANRGPQNTERTNAERNNGGNNPNRPPNATSGGNSNNRATYNHPSEVPQHSAPQADNNVNQKYQQQQEKLVQKQNQEHQQLQQKQEQEHQRATQQQMPAPRQQQMEQKHQQQTQQMEQKHTQQQQKIQQKAAPPPHQSESKPHKQ